MSYIGKVEMNDANIKHYSLTGSTLTTVNIGWTPASEQSLRVTINGVVQQGGSFSLSGSNLTLGGPLVATDDLEVVGIQSVGNIITPADGSVTLAKMAGGTDGNLITYDAGGDPAHVATGSATHVLTSNGAGAAPTFQAAAAGTNTPRFLAYNTTAANTISDATYTTMIFDAETIDSDSAFTSNTFTVPAGEGGVYYLSTSCEAGDNTLGYFKKAAMKMQRTPSGGSAATVAWNEWTGETLTFGAGWTATTVGWWIRPSLEVIVTLAALDAVHVELYIDVNAGGAGPRYFGNTSSLPRTKFMGFKLL